MTQNHLKMLPEVAELPEIGLYMDQLLELLEKYLSSFKRRLDEPVFTKTMINNYVKAGVISPPVKKKYSTSSMIELIMVYFFKQVYSINDTSALIKHIVDYYDQDRTVAYNRFKSQLAHLDNHAPAKDLLDSNQLDHLLQLSLDAVIKKLESEKLLDLYEDNN